MRTTAKTTVAIASIAALGVVVWVANPTQEPTPKEKMCASYQDLLDAARSNGREEMYRNDGIAKWCAESGSP